MDTRNKIIECDQTAGILGDLRARGVAVKMVLGYFDVLSAEHVRRLREISTGTGALFVAVLDPPSPVLDGRARAELVAALGMVDYVVLGGERPAQALLRPFSADEIVREESADLLRTRRLMEHVQHRHQP
jgi:bifunctional ADP-heptose synthase (sugar kinase/adenylyltransferase)